MQQTFPSKYESLAEIGTFIHQAAESAGLDEHSIYQVETAVDEACANIIEHAYGGDGNHEIRIACMIQPDTITVQLHDTGKPFNPELIKPPGLDLPLEERSDRGLGLFFINRWMDSVKFDFSESEGNTLTLKKRTGQTL